MPRERISAEEANARLPFVAAVAADAVASCGRLDAAVSAYRAERRRPLPDQAALNDGKRTIASLEDEVGACVRDVAAAGGRLEDPARGIVDFPSTLDGGDVVLCWRPGDPGVEHFHGEDEGHGERRPLAPEPVVAG